MLTWAQQKPLYVSERYCCCFVSVVAFVELSVRWPLPDLGIQGTSQICIWLWQNGPSIELVFHDWGYPRAQFHDVRTKKEVWLLKPKGILRWEIELFAFKIQIWPGAVQWRCKQEKPHRELTVYMAHSMITTMRKWDAGEVCGCKCWRETWHRKAKHGVKNCTAYVLNNSGVTTVRVGRADRPGWHHQGGGWHPDESLQFLAAEFTKNTGETITWKEER